MTELSLKIGGMTCGGCVKALTRALSRINGVQVRSVEIGAASLTYDPTHVTEKDIQSAIERAGYQVGQKA